MSKQRIAYTPIGGVCSKMMIVEAEDNMITGVQIVGGCQGNTRFIKITGRYGSTGRHTTIGGHRLP